MEEDDGDDDGDDDDDDVSQHETIFNISHTTNAPNFQSHTANCRNCSVEIIADSF
jgi:hypothetical protein